MLPVRAATRSSRKPRGVELKVSGFILAGGRSARFGSEKPSAELGQKEMIDHVLDAVRSNVDDLFIVGGEPRLAAARSIGHIVDDAPHQGPWSAIGGVSRSVVSDLYLFAPCDVPLLKSASVALLRSAATSNGVAVLSSQENVHWSVSAWTHETLVAAVQRAAQSSVTSLHGAIEPFGPALVGISDIEMTNVNTTADLAQAADHLAHWNDD